MEFENTTRLFNPGAQRFCRKGRLAETTLCLAIIGRMLTAPQQPQLPRFYCIIRVKAAGLSESIVGTQYDPRMDLDLGRFARVIRYQPKRLVGWQRCRVVFLQTWPQQ